MVVEDFLRLHLDAGGDVQKAQYRLPRRLAQPTEQRDDRTEARSTIPSLGSGSPQLVDRARAQMQRRIPQDDEVQRAQSRAAASKVSAAVATRSPSTITVGTGRGCRVTSKPGRCGWAAAFGTAAKTGRSTAAGSHQPRNSAELREVNQAQGGSTRLQAASSSASRCVLASARGRYRPRDTRCQRGDRVAPRKGRRSAGRVAVDVATSVRCRART